MMGLKKAHILVAIGVIIALGFAMFQLFLKTKPLPETVELTPVVVDEIPALEKTRITTIGQSVEGRPITAYEYGTGERHILFVGAIHGGYEWNSALLAYDYMDYLELHINELPDNVTVSIIPVLNPDGVYMVTHKEGRFTQTDVLYEDQTIGTGRFNANNVDLNRNFACKWQPKSTWRGNEVSAGTSAFSEPEALALKGYVETYQPDGVIFWHSQSNAVYASECENGILPGTIDLMNSYATAAGYKSVATFDAYPVTGDAEGWLASIGIPAITVELATHETLEWEKNLKGIENTITLLGK